MRCFPSNSMGRDLEGFIPQITLLLSSNFRTSPVSQTNRSQRVRCSQYGLFPKVPTGQKRTASLEGQMEGFHMGPACRRSGICIALQGRAGHSGGPRGQSKGDFQLEGASTWGMLVHRWSERIQTARLAA